MDDLFSSCCDSGFIALYLQHKGVCRAKCLKCLGAVFVFLLFLFFIINQVVDDNVHVKSPTKV